MNKRVPSRVRRYLAQIGSQGGKKSRRKLDPLTARRMVAVREAKKAFRRYHTECFWSYRPEAKIGPEDLSWVIRGLKTEGDRNAYELARRIERYERE